MVCCCGSISLPFGASLSIGTTRTTKPKWYHCVVRWSASSKSICGSAEARKQTLSFAILLVAPSPRMDCGKPSSDTTRAEASKRQASIYSDTPLPANTSLIAVGTHLLSKRYWDIAPWIWRSTIVRCSMRTSSRTSTTSPLWLKCGKRRSGFRSIAEGVNRRLRRRSWMRKSRLKKPAFFFCKVLVLA
mgnify:CR=1 FL=1